MKTINKDWFDYEKILTESDILEIAKRIGEIRKKIDEIEEARKTLKDLQNKSVYLSRQLEQGKIKGNFYGVHSYHDPVENMVTISPGEIGWKINEFVPFTREMTQYEKEKYCQHTIDFKEPEEEEGVTERAVTQEEEVEFLTRRLEDIQAKEVEDSAGDQEEEPEQGDEDSFKDRPGFEEFHMKGDYYIKAPDSFSSAMVWTVFQHCGSGVYPEGMGTFYRESDAIKKVRELRHNDLQEVKKELQEKRKEAEALQEQTTADQIPVYKSEKDGSYFLLDNEGNRLPLTVLIEADITITFIDPFDKGQYIVKRILDIRLRDTEQSPIAENTIPDTPAEPEPLSSLHVYKSPTDQYYILDEQLNPIQLKVLNSLENVVFLEQEGVEGVILKRHSEVTPGGELE